MKARNMMFGLLAAVMSLAAGAVFAQAPSGTPPAAESKERSGTYAPNTRPRGGGESAAPTPSTNAPATQSGQRPLEGGASPTTPEKGSATTDPQRPAPAVPRSDSAR